VNLPILNRTVLLGIACTGFVMAAACSTDDSDTAADTGPVAAPAADAGAAPTSNTLADIATADPQFSLLVAAAVKADLVSVLSGDDALTVFAPTNDAFAASGLDEAAIDALTPAEARLILMYHAVAGMVASSDLSAGVVMTAAQLSVVVGTEGGVTLNGGNTVAGGATVVSADIPADNGMIHVIDRVLMPPTIADLVRYAGLTELGAAVAAAGLGETLAGEGPFTVFAPTNDAFPDDTSGLNVMQILTYHALSGAVASSDVTSGPVTTLATQSFGEGGNMTSINLSLLIDASDGVRINDTANVVIADVRATNGIVHVIDAVLVPLNVAQVAVAGGFTQLVAAVVASDPIPAQLAGGDQAVPVLEALSTLSALTVFAPTDAAFAAAFPNGLPADGGAILGVLAGHAVAGAAPVMAAGLPTDATAQVPALVGSLTFDSSATPPTVSLVAGSTANIVATDIGATNGVVHVIDAVLVPAP
jgi:transforming growth factor-beta-induced protein